MSKGIIFSVVLFNANDEWLFFFYIQWIRSKVQMKWLTVFAYMKSFNHLNSRGCLLNYILNKLRFNYAYAFGCVLSIKRALGRWEKKFLLFFTDKNSRKFGFNKKI